MEWNSKIVSSKLRFVSVGAAVSYLPPHSASGELIPTKRASQIKKLLLSILVVCSLIAAFLVAQRSVRESNVKLSEPDSTHPQVEPFALPPRPAIEVFDPSSTKQSEIADLRTVSFDLAESTYTALPNDPEAICLLGKLHLRSGNADAARRLWDHALQLNPNFAEAHVDYGNYELNLGNYAQAAERFRTAIRLDPSLLEAYKSLANAEIPLRQLERAASTIESYLLKSPSDVAMLCKLGSVYQQLAKYPDAIAAYSRALKLETNSTTALQGLASTYRSAGNAEQATQFADQAAKLIASLPRVAESRNANDPDLVKGREVLDFVTRSATRILVRTQRATLAISLLEKAKAKIPDSDSIRGVLIDLYLAGNDSNNAISLLEEHCAMHQDDVQGWLSLGTQCLKARRFQPAELAIRKVIELQPTNSEAYAMLAQVQLVAANNPSGAIVSARKAVELAPTAQNRFVLGTILYFAGDVETAKTEIQRAVQLEPGNAQFRTALEQF